MPHHPKRGSLAFSPRKRAKRHYSRIRREIKTSKNQIVGFSAYKAGTTHVLMIDDRKNVSSANKELSKVVTVLDAPPMHVIAIRLYKKENMTKKLITEAWTSNITQDLLRKLTLPEKLDHNQNLEEIQSKLNTDSEYDIRVVVATQPRLTKIKKRPDVMEYCVGGKSALEKFEYAKEKLGKEVSIKEIFSEGEYIDVSAITKGKGTEGFVKRWGVRIQNRKSKQKDRHVGSIGPWTPAGVMWTVPNVGQLGFHQRTEYNKRILKTGDNGIEITPSGGFLGYGLVRGEYVIVAGTVPGPRSRLIRMNPAVRSKYPTVKPNITYISVESKQGV